MNEEPPFFLNSFANARRCHKEAAGVRCAACGVKSYNWEGGGGGEPPRHCGSDHMCVRKGETDFFRA